MNTQTPFAIISAHRAEYTSAVNAWRSQSLESQLTHRDLAPKRIEGCYHGIREESWLVLVPQGEAGYVFRTMLPQLARRWGQESWLYVDANRVASLHYCDGRPTEVIGQWQHAESSMAHAQDAFSYDPDSDAYYIVRA